MRRLGKMKILKKIALVIIIAVIGVIYSYSSWPQAVYDVNIDSGAYEATPLLVGDSHIEQDFVCKYNGLNQFQIRLDTMQRAKIGKYNWAIVDNSSNEIVREGEMDISKLDKKNNCKIKFDKIKDSKEKSYKVLIYAKSVAEDESISVLKTSDNELVIKVYMKRFNVETFVVFLGIGVYLVAFIKFMSKLFQ
jgi:hypothetical protein